MAVMVDSGTPSFRAPPAWAPQTYMASSSRATVMAARTRMSSEPSKRTYAPRCASRPASSGLCRNIVNGPWSAPRLATIESTIAWSFAATWFLLVIGVSLAIGSSVVASESPESECRGESCLAKQRVHAVGREDGAPDLEPPVEGVRNGVGDRRRRRAGGALTDAADAERVVVGREVKMLHHERRHVRGPRQGIVHQRARQELAVVAVHDVLAQDHPEPLGEAAHDLPVDDHGMKLTAAVVHDDVADDRHPPGLHVDLDDGRVHPARPGDRRRRVELRGPEPGAALFHQAPLAERHARQLAERDRARGGAHQERARVLDPHVVGRALQEPRGHGNRLLLHRRRGHRYRVAGVDGDAARAGSVAVRGQRRVAAAHTDVVERRAEILGADLGEDGLVSLARAGDADEHLDVAVLVDLHRGPLAGADTAARFQVARDAETDPAALRAQLGLALAPAPVVEQIERAPELQRIVAAVVADGHAVAVDEPGPIRHLRRRDHVP